PVREGYLSKAKEQFMEHIEKSIDVNAPLSMVYNQWTQFEDFPEFMEGVREVRQLDDKRLHWRAKIGGKEKEWEAEIFEQGRAETGAWRGEIHGRDVQPDTGESLKNTELPRSQRMYGNASTAAPVANENASGKLG